MYFKNNNQQNKIFASLKEIEFAKVNCISSAYKSEFLRIKMIVFLDNVLMGIRAIFICGVFLVITGYGIWEIKTIENISMIFETGKIIGFCCIIPMSLLILYIIGAWVNNRKRNIIDDYYYSDNWDKTE